MNPLLDLLQPYPFEKIRQLLSGLSAPQGVDSISFAIGEPKHLPPAFVLEELHRQLDQIAVYPVTKGIESLRQSICRWLSQRFNIAEDNLDPDSHVLPVNGTREALFAFAQAVINPQSPGKVAYPNPFYQIYEGATLLAGATPVLINCTETTGYAPDFASVSADTWRQIELLYICTPGNPTGSVLSIDTLKELIALADEHDFIIASDECYSEIYPDEGNPPPGLLEACAASGRNDFKRCVVFHSLSKRSNLPGLRSGFVAGDSDILAKFLLYRTYHGCAMSLPTQLASIVAWNDEKHVQQNRAHYREKFEGVLEILSPVIDVSQPDAGFYLWPKTPISDTALTRELFSRANLNVVPGSYLARNTTTGNPGENRLRLALVAETDDCLEGARRMRQVIEGL
jgi:N-succinyldiaminopimelate aminotransferase